MKRVLFAVLLLAGCRHAAIPEAADMPAPAALPARSAAESAAPAAPVPIPTAAAKPVREGPVPLPAAAAESPAPAEVPVAPRFPAPAETPAAVPPAMAASVPEPEARETVDALCREVGDKLGSVSVEDCLAQALRPSGRYSVNGRVLALRDFASAGEARAETRVLIMGGIHGDEYSSISIMFKWMALLAEAPGAGGFSWRFLPVVNPDGLLDGQAVRQNANGVDLNRNFPSRDWRRLALANWKDRTGSNPRRYPGSEPASEPEVRWVVEQILAFRPDVIVSVHAPYHLLDYDGPARAPEKIGELYLHQLGVYPGSLGNYAGVDLGLPVVTLELPSAGIMPTRSQIATMWSDLLDWLRKREEEGAS